MTEARLGQQAQGIFIRPVWTQMIFPVEALNGELEMQWLERALEGQSIAALWRDQPGLVAPLSYRRHANLADVSAASLQQGWPIRLRRSGGGVVPQGPGILNLSLAYPCEGAPATMSGPVYAHLCGLLGYVLECMGIACQLGAIAGSFCDGRFNLAVSTQGKTRKIAGTAQYWRRANGRQAVLAHALLLLDADPQLLCAQANRFEAALGSARHYDAAALTSVAQCWSAAHTGQPVPADLFHTVTQRIAAALLH